MRFLAAMVLVTAIFTEGDSIAAQDTAARRAILDALRQQLKAWTGLEVVFEVKYLKAKDGWAWVAAFPRSPGGVNKYEPVEALLHRQSGSWKVMEMRPGGPDCEEDPDCADLTRYYRKLRSRFPHAPAEIFPK